MTKSTAVETIAITMGDPAGIGPEIIVKACREMRNQIQEGKIRLLIIGSMAALRAAQATVSDGPDIPETQENSAWPALAILQAAPEGDAISTGVISSQGGRMAYFAIECAVRLALAHRIRAIVTAPLNKEALNLAGYRFAGHTDMLAHLTGASDSVMMLAHGNMHVSHVSTHVALKDVPKKLTPTRLKKVIELTEKALRGLGISQPKIAVAALNPHAGEGGLFGTEDIEISQPVIDEAVSRGLRVFGPVPGDTVFVKLRAGQFDAVIAMYHDQGHIPIKLLGFKIDEATGRWEALNGVNITLGLPIIRTSVDHGTAFDIAGKGIASETSLVEAIDYAVKLANGPVNER